MSLSSLKFGGLFDVELALRNLPFVLTGLPMTLLISFLGMVIGLVLGLFLTLARMSGKWYVNVPALLYISFMRGTPILVFLFILYFGLPIIGIEFDRLTAAVLGFGLNSAAYIAEVKRASFESIDRGQWQSAKALNFTYGQTLSKIIFPQAIRIALPPLINVFLDILKATSLAAVITVPELFQKAQIVAGREFDSMTMYILIAFIYWPVCALIEWFQNRLEKRSSRFLV